MITSNYHVKHLLIAPPCAGKTTAIESFRKQLVTRIWDIDEFPLFRPSPEHPTAYEKASLIDIFIERCPDKPVILVASDYSPLLGNAAFTQVHFWHPDVDELWARSQCRESGYKYESRQEIENLITHYRLTLDRLAPGWSFPKHSNIFHVIDAIMFQHVN